ncbi:MAG: sigma 54-interacting transcriptional regulator [Clostridia bacterium]|nr:sigma 54-interacting transcriptional regulator [Clostridia bacterium]
MIHIAFIMPDPALVKVVHEAWALYEKLFGKRPDMQYTVDCELQPDVVVSRHYDADVIVSRGGTAAGLKARNVLTPVVEIPITSSDMAASIRLALSKHGKMPIGVVGTINTIRSVYFMKKEFPVTVKPYPTASVNIRDLIDGMERAVADGCRLILAGHRTCDYCEKHGIPAGLIYSSVESVFLAIIEAMRCAGVSQVEKQNSLIFRAAVEHMFEGIIAVDKDNMIRTFNPAAAELLGRKAEDYIGQPVQRALPEGRLSAILLGNQSYTNEIVRINGNNCVLNCAIMNHDGKRLGTLVTFQAAQSITNAESRLRDRLRVSGHVARYHFDDILGESPAIHTAIYQARRFARVDSNILLMGETGTGKELFAQSIHNESDRAHGPFVAVNCAAIPENLMESELFGYEGGAFTGASKTGKEGLFEAAHEGTIFLDEVSEIPLALQSRLLRVIQEREVRRVGANRVIPINVRIICATNRDLLDMIRQGRFREDLYYRLKVLSVQLPPLRERDGDMALIMQHYLTYYAHKFGKDQITLSPEAAARVAAYRWPGNIREIRNISEQLAVLSESELITGADVAMVLPASQIDRKPTVLENNDDPTLSALQKRQIMEVLSRAKSRKEAAEMLGISKTTLWRKCKELGLE